MLWSFEALAKANKPFYQTVLRYLVETTTITNKEMTHVARSYGVSHELCLARYFTGNDHVAMAHCKLHQGLSARCYSRFTASRRRTQKLYFPRLAHPSK